MGGRGEGDEVEEGVAERPMWKMLSAAINRFVTRSYEQASTEPAGKKPAKAIAPAPGAPRPPELLTGEGVEQQFQRAAQLLRSGNKAAAEEAIHLAV